MKTCWTLLGAAGLAIGLATGTGAQQAAAQPTLASLADGMTMAADQPARAFAGSDAATVQQVGYAGRPYWAYPPYGWGRHRPWRQHRRWRRRPPVAVIERPCTTRIVKKLHGGASSTSSIIAARAVAARATDKNGFRWNGIMTNRINPLKILNRERFACA